MRKFNKCLIVAALMVSFSLPALANKQDDLNAIETPITKWMAAENAMIDKLPIQNQKIFFVLRNKDNVIRSVKMVERDVQIAVKSCAKENPEIGSEIKSRFKDWQNAVNPILKEAESFLKKELKEQEAFHISDYKHITKLNDKAFEFSEEQIQKKPVSSLEACQGLIKSMDRSENQLVELLQDILLPEEVVRKRLERAKEAQDAQKNQKK